MYKKNRCPHRFQRRTRCRANFGPNAQPNYERKGKGKYSKNNNETISNRIERNAIESESSEFEDCL